MSAKTVTGSNGRQYDPVMLLLYAAHDLWQAMRTLEPDAKMALAVDDQAYHRLAARAHSLPAPQLARDHRMFLNQMEVVIDPNLCRVAAQKERVKNWADRRHEEDGA